MKRPSFARDYGFSAAMTARDVQPRARLDVLFEELRDLFSGAGNTPPVALMGGAIHTSPFAPDRAISLRG